MSFFPFFGSVENSWKNISTTVGLTKFMFLLKILDKIFLLLQDWPISQLCWRFLVKYFYYHMIDKYHGSAGNSAWNISTTIGLISQLYWKLFIEYFYKPKFDQYHGSAGNSWWNISTTVGLNNFMALLKVFGKIFLLLFIWPILWL